MRSLKSTEYETAIGSLFNRLSTRRQDLTVMERLMASWGNPERAFPSVHIGGTNGKGSVSRKLATALENAGYRVGLYISPHIAEFEERITINGEKIPKQQVVDYYAQIDDPEFNFFECATWMCFQYFKEKQVDIGIIEVGLGGTLDSTNVLKPVLSIITSIGLDHTEYLGDTLDKIAAQKAGIIKPHTPVVLGPRIHSAPIYERAKAVHAPLIQVTHRSPLYEEENNAVVVEALKILPFRSDVEAGLAAGLPCRFERRGRFILDVAHNAEGFSRLKEALQYTFPNQTFHFIIGMSRRKDLKGCLQAIEEKIAHVHFVESGRADGATVFDLEKAFQAVSRRPYSLDQKMDIAIEKTPKEITVICGSFYIMAGAIMHIERESPTP
ncbi:MAG: bifunctional folylpolyglutamate synthase/dihydrofolate synthase [Verrucomicrobia bacterium]|nr:bifunctional folylpolyglutamate synthase/dihydrofolate synthase [Verrucomicrobiota bacterium]